jgi:alanyl-tRNA synthetase
LESVANVLSTTPSEVESRVNTLLDELTELRADAKSLGQLQASAQTEELKKSADKIDGVFIISNVVKDTDKEGLKVIADQLRSELGVTVILLATEVDGRVAFLCTVSHELVEKGLNAGNIIRAVATIAGGGGGGRPELAEAGGRDVSQISNALQHGRDLITASLDT